MASSIHITAAKGHSESHNLRLCQLNYVYPERTKLNESWSEKSIKDATAEAKEICKIKTGRTMQEKATPIREGVLNLLPNHNIEDLKKLGLEIENKFGIKCIQTYIHRDEGHYDLENNWKPNLHGHMIFDWTDHQTGKSIKLNRDDMRDFQTIVADSLGMERGISSEKKHLNSLQFKIEAKKEDVKNLNQSIKSLTNNLSNFQDIEKSAKELKNKAILGMHKQSSIDMLENALKAKEIALQEKEKVIKELEFKISNLPNISKTEFEKQNKSLEASLKFLENHDLKIIEPRRFAQNQSFEVVDKDFKHKTVNELRQEAQTTQNIDDLTNSKSQNRGYKI